MVADAAVVPIRPDIHQRFMTLVARAEAKVKAEQEEIRRRLIAGRPEPARPPGRRPQRAG